MIKLGLTGSVGMGKSTTAGLFAEEGAAVWDADAAVHRLYAEGGAGVRAIERLAPDAILDGAVDRSRLRSAILADPDLLKKVEAVIHPLVAEDRAEFLKHAEAEGAKIAVLDIPLLFETGGEAQMDVVVVVSAPADVQRARVMDRPGMTDDAFQAILAKQMPDSEKRSKAGYVIDTSKGMEAARDQVRAVISAITKDQAHA
jgi:dephospho-CoA kinase